MVLFNHATREMTAKIVYYGPGLCGKTTNLMVIFDKLDSKQKGKMLSLATKTDRTLFFDLLPVDLGKVGPFNLKIQLYTVPGQVFYNETRKLVLKGADSVVFVADSQPAMVDATRESFANLLENLQENSIDANDIPIVIQYNKRDLPGVLPVEQLAQALGFENYPHTAASALKGEGVMETFKLVSKITAKHLVEKMKPGKAESGPRKAVTEEKKPAAPAAPAPKAKAPVEAAPPPPVEEPPSPAVVDNPFASAMPAADPFPEASPINEGYEAMEEVSLEQLLEGRERPLTFSGAVPIPIDEVEELQAEHLVPEAPKPKAAAKAAAPPAASGSGDRVQALEREVSELRDRLQIMRDERRTALQSILQELNELTQRVRQQIEG